MKYVSYAGSNPMGNGKHPILSARKMSNKKSGDGDTIQSFQVRKVSYISSHRRDTS